MKDNEKTNDNVAEYQYIPNEAIHVAVNQLVADAKKSGGIEYNAVLEKLVPLEAGANDMDYALKTFEDNGVTVLKDGVKASILTSK